MFLDPKLFAENSREDEDYYPPYFLERDPHTIEDRIYIQSVKNLIPLTK